MFTRLLDKWVDISLHIPLSEVYTYGLFVVLLVDCALYLLGQNILQNIFRFPINIYLGQLVLSPVLDNYFVRSRLDKLFFDEIVIFL